MLACAAAADAGARLFVLNGPDIISEFVGESEAGLQVLSPDVLQHFEKACMPSQSAAAPEIDDQDSELTLSNGMR